MTIESRASLSSFINTIYKFQKLLAQQALIQFWRLDNIMNKELQMIKIAYILGLGSFAMAIGCSSTRARVIEQTESTAVIEGRGPTEYEAKKNAQAKASELFETFKESKEAECSQGYRASGHTSGTGAHKSYSSAGRSYFSCVIFASKS